MPRTIRPVAFKAEHLDLQAVQQFDCGSAPWATEVADWIANRGPEGVLYAINQFRTEVWLYATEDDGVVGFGSLGKTRWNLAPGSPRLRLYIIPNLGLGRCFQGQPDDGTEDRFSNQIMDHLISEARARVAANIRHPNAPEPVLGLFVHPENTKAQHIYTARFNFQPTTVTNTNDETGVVYEGLLLNL